MVHSPRNWIPWRWDVPVQLNLLCRHGGDGHSVWERGEVYGVHIPSSHPYPCLSNERRIGSEEGIHCCSGLGRSLAPVLLEARLDCAAECPVVLLVPGLACRNPSVNETPGFR